MWENTRKWTVWCFHLFFALCGCVLFFFFCLTWGYGQKPLIEISNKREVGGTREFVKSNMAAIGYWRDVTFCYIDAGEWKRRVSRWWIILTALANRQNWPTWCQSTHAIHQCYRTESCFWPNCLCSSRMNSLLMRSSLSSAELTRYIRKTWNSSDRNLVADQRCRIRKTVSAHCYLRISVTFADNSIRPANSDKFSALCLASIFAWWRNNFGWLMTCELGLERTSINRFKNMIKLVKQLHMFA